MAERRILMAFGAGACLLALSACATYQTPAVSGARPPGQRPGAAPATPAPPAAEATIIVRAGETLADVAARAGATTRELIETNGLSAPFRVRPGQVLKVPPTPIYVVQPGDTATGLARRYGLSLSTIVRQNGLEPPYALKVGQRLVLPPGGRPPQPAPAPPPSALAQAQAPSPAPMPPVTAQALAAPSASAPPPVAPARPAPQYPPPPARTGVIQAEPLAPVSAPPPPPAVALETPAEAIVPEPPKSDQPKSDQPKTEPAKTEPARVEVPKVEPPKAEPPKTDAEKRVAEVPVAPPAPSRMVKGGPRFVWPVQGGEVISRFGAKPGGLHNDGINIAVREGTPVLAAADGVVAYAGKELKGFGNLILIRHANGWMSAYAHNESLLVARGDEVRRAQPIARVGKTGEVDRAQLHFELREETEAVDPLAYLPRKGNHPRLG